MTTGEKRGFGGYVREKRKEKDYGLREMAKMVGVSPTYLSKVERGEFAPPAEDRVKKIAEILGCDPDELLAMAGKVSSELTDIIRQQPKEMASFLRSAKNLTAEQMVKLAEEAEKGREE